MNLNDQNDLKSLRALITAKLNEIDPGLSFCIGNIKFQRDGSSATIEVKAASKAILGDAPSPYVIAWNAECRGWGLKKEALGLLFIDRGRQYKVEGLRPKARTTPVVVKEMQSGKLFRLPVEALPAEAKFERSFSIRQVQ
jgi:hypothetical protein